jgi:hypothetical protein
MAISRWIPHRMRNVSDKSCRESDNTHFMFSNFFSESRAVYEICGKPQNAFLRFHCNNGYANAPQSYVSFRQCVRTGCVNHISFGYWRSLVPGVRRQAREPVPTATDFVNAWRMVVPASSGSSNPNTWSWSWRRSYSSKYLWLFTGRHNVTVQKAWILSAEVILNAFYAVSSIIN